MEKVNKFSVGVQNIMKFKNLYKGRCGMEKSTDQFELTAPEIASLWETYQQETMSICTLEFFLMHVEDEQIKQLLEDSLENAKERKLSVIDFFERDGFPVPQGFTNNDVHLNAPRLFKDRLYLQFIIFMTKMGLTSYSFSFMNAVRSDLLSYYSSVIEEINDMSIRANEVAKEKGIFIYPPHIPKPKEVEFVKKESFITGWLGERRPLNALEISNLVFNALRNSIGQAVITGFSQVAKSKEVRRYFERGRDISTKHLEVFSSILHEDYLSDGSLIMTTDVTDSTEAPYTDKMMMFLISMLISSGIGQYGASMAMSPRRDLGAHYTRLTAEIATYADDGLEIMIKNNWLEQPPLAADRKNLAK